MAFCADYVMTKVMGNIGFTRISGNLKGLKKNVKFLSSSTFIFKSPPKSCY